MGLLDGKVAVVTAAGSGMGKASARIFAREGAKLVISDISGAEAQTAAEIGGDIVARCCDVSDEMQVAALVEAAVAKFGRLDAMLNVAGVPYGGIPIDAVEAEGYDFAMNVILKGVFWGTKYAVRAMKNNGGGSIINFSSLAGLIPSPNSAVYSSAKAGVAHLTRCTAVDYGRFNIRANAICPGMIATEGMGKMALQHMPQLASANPLGRAGKPEDAGELCAFLASDRANYLNGVIIPLDGGWACKLA
jgi:NAD(P)-dependent dehydrogenase (short-subunit alcohol dehydrogenase family)